MHLYILLALIGAACGQSVGPSQKALENPNLYQGDIFLGNVSRTGMFLENQLWSKGVIPYVIDESVYHNYVNIQLAMAHIQQKTCIRFVQRTDEKDYVNIFSGTGCNGGWGKMLMGAQPLSLQKGQCESVGIIIHELMHAIGFLHEHVRYDRDKYIEIFWDNIENGKKVEFEIKFPEQAKTFDGFDYDSIMLYGPKAFSKDQVSDTMRSKNKHQPLVDIWDKGKLSGSDIYRVGKLYRHCQNP